MLSRLESDERGLAEIEASIDRHERFVARQSEILALRKSNLAGIKRMRALAASLREDDPEPTVNVAGLSAIDANMGDVTAGYVLAINDAVADDLAALKAQIDKLQADVPSMALKAVQDAKRRNRRL